MNVSLNEESQAIWQAENLEHLRYEYDLRPDDLVIDIGAYRGEWAEQIYRLHKCKLILIEPTPYILGFPYGEIVNKAAWTHDGVLKFGGAYYYSSSYEMPTDEYPCFDLNELLTKYDDIAVVKINVEGAEYELLNHIIDAGLHKRIRNLQVQFHLIEGQPVEEMYGAIAERLSETHKLTWRFGFCWENWQRD